jgi:subtilase family serine protease
MTRRHLTLLLLLILTFAATPANAFLKPLASPDLAIGSYEFAPTNDKVVRVRIVNRGNAPAAACRLLLTVRKINGVAVGRKTQINVPALAANKETWLLVNAKSILPNNVALEATTFRLNVDATELVNELDENNNEVWHNL